MAEERKDSFAETVDTAASAAHTVKGAIKAGKAISGAAKGAAAGGPYGAVAGAVWAGRKHIGKIIAVIIILLLLPVLFILMLPGLIFGGLINAFSPADTEQPVLNSETAIVASRREAMMRKRQTFYFDLDPDGMYRVYEGRIVQARVIAVAEKVVRVEVFGVECSILARDLAWDWIGDAHERFSVGDEVLVRILSVRRNSLEDLGIRADIKSTSENTDRDNLQKCRIQGKYAGKVTDVHKGVVYVRLANGVNAVAHSCYDYRMPGKKDDVSFAVTRLDMERGVAVGIITRIIRQNL